MVSMAPLRIPFPSATASAAGKKHNREDSPSTPTTPTLASMSKKRVRFASGAEKARNTDDYDSDATMTSVTASVPGKKSKVAGSSMRSMFKMFVANALDERAVVRSHLFFPVCPALWDSV